MKFVVLLLFLALTYPPVLRFQMDDSDHPSFTVADGETPIDDLRQFFGCSKIIREIAAQTTASVTDVTHTHSDTWGFIMRGNLRGAMSSRFVCWHKPEQGSVEFWIE